MILFESDRLYYRKFQLSDAEDFYHLNTDEEVMKYTGDQAFQNVEDAKHFLATYNPYSITGFGRWSVIRKSDDQLLGWCGLKQLNSNEIDLGYRFHKKYWNQGFATEASIQSLRVGFEDYKLKEIIGRTSQQNTASIRVLEKIGMKFYKTAPCEGIADSVYYKITDQEFRLLW